MSEQPDPSRIASRRLILYRLELLGMAGALPTTCREVLKPAVPGSGPFSEDLQDLVREGVVLSICPVAYMSMDTKVWLP